MLCGNDITGRGIFKRTSLGVIYGYAQHSVFKARINGNFFIIDVFFFAGVKRIFKQIADYNGNICFGNKNIAWYICLYNIVDTVAFCLLCKIKQHGVCGGVFAKAYQRIVR